MSEVKDCRGVSPVDDPEVQRLSSVRYDNHGLHIRWAGPDEDRWALYDKSYNLVAVGPWDSLRAIARDIPPAVSTKQPTFTTPKVDIDLGELGL